jgi:GGDEF domain-containing protein
VLALRTSLGAALYAGAEGLPAAIQRADKAMYEEKARNRHPAPVPHRVTQESALFTS